MLATTRIVPWASVSLVCRLTIIVEMLEAIVRIHSDVLHSHDPRHHRFSCGDLKAARHRWIPYVEFHRRLWAYPFPTLPPPLARYYIILQPTASRSGLTFTEALIAPTAEAHLAPLPSDQVVRKLCGTEHAPVTAETILDPINGMTCNACHSPPVPGSGQLPVPPDGNATRPCLCLWA